MIELYSNIAQIGWSGAIFLLNCESDIQNLMIVGIEIHQWTNITIVLHYIFNTLNSQYVFCPPNVGMAVNFDMVEN
jgi:hypothetical protein